jgi:gliding motility-associated-like protein
MKNLLLVTTIFTLLFSSSLFAQNPNCYVTVSPLDTTICPGDSVFIQGYANLLGAGQSFNFNASTLPAGWSTTGTTFFSAPCGPHPNGTPYYWASTASAGSIPGIQTAAFDITCGGVVIFDMIYSVQGGSSPCEGPDQYNEGVSLQYSLNGGLTWIDIIYYAPNGATLPANPGVTTPGANGITPFTSWNTFTVPIPAGALSTSTMFRWTQSSTSGSCCDNWGLENIIINATAAPCGTSTVLNWSNGLNDTTSFWFSPSQDTTLYAVIFDTNGVQQCISDTITVNLFDGNFTYSLPGAANVYCPLASTNVSVTNIQNAGLPVSYLWSTGSTTSTATISGLGVTPANIWYYVDVTDACGYVIPDSVLLNVNQTLAIASFSVNPQINCALNGSAAAVVTGNQGTPVHQWTNSAGQTANPVGNNANNLVSGWYYVTVTDNVCTISDSVFVPQTLVPITFNLPDTVTTNCLAIKPPAPTTALQNAPGATFLWTTAGGTPLPFNNSGNNGFLSYYNLPNNGISPAFITYNVTVFSCGNSVTKSVVLHVTNINNLNFNLPDTLKKFCPGDSIAVDVTGITGASNTNPPIPLVYDWSNGGTTFTTWLTSTGLDNETIPYTVTLTDACGYTKTKTVVFVIDKLLNIDDVQSTASTACQPDGSVLAIVSGNTGPAQFLWEDSLNYITPGSGDSTQSNSWNNISPGWYYFTVVDNVCSDLDSVFVDIINAPTASFTVDKSDGCAGMSVIFTNTSQNTSYFEWDFGNGNTSIDNAITTHAEQYFAPATVTLWAYDNSSKTCGTSTTLDISIVVCGCTDPNAINYDPNAVVQDGLCIYPIPVVQDPNVFTPNGDGQNDLFFFETVYTTEFKLTITNRWGNVMYDKILDLTAPVGSQGWDGRSPNGSEAKAGTYFYKYTAIGINGDEVEGKGFLQLVRD